MIRHSGSLFWTTLYCSNSIDYAIEPLVYIAVSLIYFLPISQLHGWRTLIDVNTKTLLSFPGFKTIATIGVEADIKGLD